MKYIDIHAHLDFKDFDSDRKEIIEDMIQKEIGAFNVGTNFETSSNSILLAEQNKNIWAIVGVHPLYVNEVSLEELKKIEPLISHPKCVAIGECGMDLFRIADDQETKKRQVEFFEKQIELALTHTKPLMIHCRQAYPETLEILKSYKKTEKNLHAHFHFFTESIDTARTILDLDFTLSFTGPITFADYDELIRFISINSMMVETDSPYASPKSLRGKRNDPRNVIEIIQKIADIKQLSFEETAQTLLKNTQRVFHI